MGRFDCRCLIMKKNLENSSQVSVDQIEEAVYKEDLTDMQDIVKEVMAKKEKTVRR